MKSKSAASKKSKASGKIRYGVVGLGDLAQVAVLPAFKNTRNSELVALVSGEQKKLEALGKMYRVQNLFTYDEFEESLEYMDAVYLVTPNNLHRGYAVRAAAAGVHVLCEKPMAVSEQDCRAMIDAANKARVKLMIAYRLHFEQGNLEAIRIAQSGKIGEPRIFVSEFGQQVTPDNVRVTDPVAKGGGPVYDMGVYCINAARYLFQADPTEVFAWPSRNGEKRFSKVEEMMTVVMRFPKDRLASFTCSFGSSDISHYSLIGTKGVLTMEPAFDYSKPLKQTLSVGKKQTTRTFKLHDQFAAEISYFSDCILKNRQPEPSGLEGLADIRIVLAIYKSAKSGKPVKINRFPFKRRPSPSMEIDRKAHARPRTIGVKSPSGH